MTGSWTNPASNRLLRGVLPEFPCRYDRHITCSFSGVPVQQYARRYAQRRIISRVSRATPWLGMALAALAIRSAMRRKGVLRGALDSALNALPGVGAVKNAAEVIRGRDFFPDRQRK